jgi:hypothetical protein
MAANTGRSKTRTAATQHDNPTTTAPIGQSSLTVWEALTYCHSLPTELTSQQRMILRELTRLFDTVHPIQVDKFLLLVIMAKAESDKMKGDALRQDLRTAAQQMGKELTATDNK